RTTPAPSPSTDATTPVSSSNVLGTRVTTGSVGSGQRSDARVARRPRNALASGAAIPEAFALEARNAAAESRRSPRRVEAPRAQTPGQLPSTTGPRGPIPSRTPSARSPCTATTSASDPSPAEERPEPVATREASSDRPATTTPAWTPWFHAPAGPPASPTG